MLLTDFSQCGSRDGETYRWLEGREADDSWLNMKPLANKPLIKIIDEEKKLSLIPTLSPLGVAS